MEKHYFKDRSKQAGIPSQIMRGDVVYMCPKDKFGNSQKNSRTIHDLQKAIVIVKLTKKNHDRGVKIIGYPIRHGINPTQEQIKRVLDYCDIHMAEIRSERGPISDKFRKGRITYLLDSDGNIL